MNVNLKLGWKVVRMKEIKQGPYVGRAMVSNGSYNRRQERFLYDWGHVTVRPHGWGPMAVFRSEKTARNFCQVYSPTEAMVIPVLYNLSRHKRLWGQISLKTCAFPIGTDFADQVMPVTNYGHAYITALRVIRKNLRKPTYLECINKAKEICAALDAR